MQFVAHGQPSTANIPLLSVQNVRPFRVIWPARSERKTYIFTVSPASQKLLVPASNYVLIRRFSAKEETRRLVASPIAADAFGGPWMALENHLNYVYHVRRPLSQAETLGIAALLNSRLLDIYFRTVSGNTQVNAADIRAMPFPDLSTLTRIGDAIARVDSADSAAVEAVILQTLRINGALRRYLLAGVADEQAA
jgi:adenine-specific DNA-methyltransferase